MANFKSPKGHSGWMQLAILLGLVGLGILAALLVQTIFMNAMGIGISDMQNKKDFIAKIANPKNAQLLQWMQFVNTLLMLFIPSWLFIRICYGKSFFWAGSSKHLNMAQVGLAFLIILVTNYYAQPLQTASEALLQFFPKLHALSKELETQYNSTVTAISNLNGIGSYLLGLIILALLPAVFEELFFRGLLQNLFVKWWQKPMLAILVTSVLFSLVHTSILLFLPRLALGYVLGVLFYYSKNIWVNIAAHFINNALALSVMFFSKKSLEQVAQVDKTLPVWSIFITLAILAFLLHYFNKASAKPVSEITMQEQRLINEIENTA